MARRISTEVIIFQLDERYKAMHIIRDRAQNVSIWFFGLFSTGAGWLVQSKITLTDLQRLFLMVVVFVFYLMVRCYYLRDLEKGFISQQKTAVRLEDELDLYDGASSLLPKEWKNAGKKKCNGNYFSTIYVMIGLGTAILLLGILIQGRI